MDPLLAFAMNLTYSAQNQNDASKLQVALDLKGFSPNQ